MIVEEVRYKIGEYMVRKVDRLCYVLVAIMCVIFIRFLGCPIRFFTGISCPGCGMTRACMSFIKGDILKSIYYHPMVVLIPFGIILFVCSNVKEVYKKYKRIIDILWIIFGVIMIITYIIRLIIGDGNIVNIDVGNSIFIKIIKQIHM